MDFTELDPEFELDKSEFPLYFGDINAVYII